MCKISTNEITNQYAHSSSYTIFRTVTVCRYGVFDVACVTLSAYGECRNNRQWSAMNESCCNDYHQSSERISAKPENKPATSCSQVCNATN